MAAASHRLALRSCGLWQRAACEGLWQQAQPSWSRGLAPLLGSTLRGLAAATADPAGLGPSRPTAATAAAAAAAQWRWACGVSCHALSAAGRGFASSAQAQPQVEEQYVEDAEVVSLPGSSSGQHHPAQQRQHQERLRAPGTQTRHARKTFKVEATYVGSKISIYELSRRHEFAGHYSRLHKNTVVLGLSSHAVPQAAESAGMPLEPYMVAFNYGAVVFFNTSPTLRQQFLDVCREVATDPVNADRPSHSEEYTITVHPELPMWSQLDPDNIKLQALDLRNMQVISQVLAQSVAMDFYSSHVERTLETFCAMNLEMQETQSLGKINKQVLLQLVAENNIVMTDIINKLGVHERYDIAWKHVQYGRIWEFLRSELEMDARFKTLDMKLNLIQDNLKYFLEILQNRKSDTLEWIIIILIGAEICLSLIDLAGKGLGG